MNFADAIDLNRRGMLTDDELRWLVYRALTEKGYHGPSQPQTHAPTSPSEKTAGQPKVETPSQPAKKCGCRGKDMCNDCVVITFKKPSLKDTVRSTVAEHFEEAKRSWTKESSRKRSLTHTGTYPEERQAPWPGDVRVVRKRFLVTNPAASELSLPVTMDAGQRFVVVALNNNGTRTIELRRPGSDLTLSSRYSAVYTHSVVTK